MAPADVLSPTDFLASAAETSVRDEYYSQGLRARFRLDAELASKRILQPRLGDHPNIGYMVDEAAFHRRSAARRAAGGLPTELPAGWPKELTGPLVWTTADYKDEASYVYFLTDADKIEIDQALKSFKGSLSLSTFLPPLSLPGCMAAKKVFSANTTHRE